MSSYYDLKPCDKSIQIEIDKEKARLKEKEERLSRVKKKGGEKPEEKEQNVHRPPKVETADKGTTAPKRKDKFTEKMTKFDMADVYEAWGYERENRSKK